MSVIVVVPEQAPWMVANQGFETLCNRTSTFLTHEADRILLLQAQSHGALFLDRLEQANSKRLAIALHRAAEELRREKADSSDDRERQFAEHFGELALLLTDLADAQGAP